MSEYTEYSVLKLGYGKITASADTIICQLIQPWRGFTKILQALTTTGATAHLLTMLRPLGRTFFTAAAAAGQRVVHVESDPGMYSTAGVGGTHFPPNSALVFSTPDNPIATNDWVAYEAADGTYVVDTVASVAAIGGSQGKILTLSTNLPTGGVAKTGLLWYFGLATDTNPNNGQPHPRYDLPANTQNVFGGKENLGTILDHPSLNLGGGSYQPLLLQIDNPTNASILEGVGVSYVRRAVGG
jgi:hypothetical protein